MLEILLSMLKMLTPVSNILMPVLWTCFSTYAAWYFISARHQSPITRKEARLLWKIHKRNTGCKAKKWREIRHGDKIIGFRCDCGHKHVQNRPIVANMPMAEEPIQPRTSAFDKLHTTYKST